MTCSAPPLAYHCISKSLILELLSANTNTVDERTTEAFQRERSGDFQRLASGNVPFDVGIGEFAEMDFGVACAAHGTPVAKSIRQWPVHSSPVAPLMRFSRSRATASLCGLP